MDFGLFFLVQRDEQWTEQAVYDSALEQMLAAEALGYHSVWIAEHHFNDYGLCPAPPVLAAFVAARTTTLRLGMGVSLLPLHHPVDLAEQLAVLDVVSGGRLDVGIGRGGTLQDYQTFQSDRADARARVEEGIAVMQQSWRGAPFDFQGRFHFRGAAPRPPAPGAAAAPAALRRVQQRGQRAVGGPPRACPRCRRSSCRSPSYSAGTGSIERSPVAAGRSETEIDGLARRAWGMRVVHVAPTRDEALRAIESPFMGYQRKMAILRSDGTGGGLPNSFDRTMLHLRPFEEYVGAGWTLIGSPDEVRDGLQQYLEATGYRRVLLLMAVPGLPTDLALRSMRLFADRVAPGAGAGRVPRLERSP